MARSILLGAYIGYDVAQAGRTIGSSASSRARSPCGVIGALLQIFVFQRLTGDELRQTLVTIGISIVAADLMLAVWGGKTYQFTIPRWLDGAVATPIITAIKSNGQIVTHALSALSARRPRRGRRHRRRPLAGAQPDPVRHDDPRRRRRSRHALGDRRQCSPAVCRRLRDRRHAGRAFPASSAARRFPIAPGEDVRYLLASLVVVIVGGMGSITGAAIGALLIGWPSRSGWSISRPMASC